MSTRLEQALPRFSLERRITVLVFVASVLVVGAVATLGIPLELIPRGFNSPHLGVFVPWRDAPPEEVLEKIVLPLEEELATVRGLDRINSTATSGYGRAWLQFKPGSDMDVAYREVRDRVQRLRARLPDDADRIFIRKEDESGIPVYVVGLAVDPEITDPWNLIQNEVVLPLQRLDGVASVETDGLEEKEILIELDRDRTEALGLNIYELGLELGGDNFTLASGNVRSGGDKLLLRSVARYRDLEELGNRPVGARRQMDGQGFGAGPQAAPAGATARLRDIATIKYEEPEHNYHARAMSKPAVAVVVLKEGDANTLEVAKAIEVQIETMRRDPRLQDVQIVPLFDQGKVIRDSLSTLVDSGLIGGVIAVAVLFFFLRRLRMTLIIALAIPLSLVIALIAMFFAGETLNIISILALMISVGMLVDNSIVVAENIYRLHLAGVPRRRACIDGAAEIALAITLATLTSVAVFLPVSLVEGEGQFFLLRLSIPISVSLLASLVVALVAIPLAVYMTLPKNGGTTEASRPQILRFAQDDMGGLSRDNPRTVILSAAKDLGGGSPAGVVALGYGVRRTWRHVEHALEWLYERTFGWLNRAYTRLLAVALGRRFDVILALLVVLAATGAVASQRVKVSPTQESEARGFGIEVEMPANTTLEEAEEWFLHAEKTIEGLKDELGLEGWFLFHRATFGELQGWFTQPRTTDITPREATERVIAALPEKPGFKLYTGEQQQEQEKEKGVHTITLFGENAEALEETALQVEAVFAQVPGVLGVRRAADRPPNELGLVLDRARAQRLGVNPEVVAGVVGYALRGQALPRYHRDGREVPVRVRFEEADRESLSDLASFEVPAGPHGAVSLASLTDVRFLPATRRIQRENQRIARPVTVELKEGEEEAAKARLEALAAELDLPEGISLGGALEAPGMNEDLKGMLFAGLLSIVFVYLLMGFLFESFILPLSIVLTIPLASIGVVWMHSLSGLNLDILGFVGAVLLIGVVVNNGIVLIDCAIRLREEGYERREALLLATERRFRPIMMTALTTIGGMIPLTFGGETSIGLSYTSFGFTLIGGMTTATLLTLLVVPVFYTLFDDTRAAVTAALRRGRRRPAAAPAAT
jgi:HAE1 family hydrophobic/amphiphilic exporter-1